MSEEKQDVFTALIKEYKREPLTGKILAKYGIAAIHPAAELFPLASDDEFQVMCTDVEARGFVHPIVLNSDDELIDGRNRLQVAWTLTLDPKVKRFNPPDVWDYVRSQNFARRHLNAWQKADIARKRADMRQGERTDVKPSEDSQKVSQEEAAKDLGTTPHAITQAKVIREWAPEEAEKADRGEATLESAYKVANGRKKEAEKLVSPEKEKRGPKTITLAGIVDKKLVEVPYPQPKGKHTFNRTNDAVDWASWTWNPVTGCLHGCKYCYAREMAYRDSYAASYPIQFAPLFHHERLDDPVNTEPSNGRAQDGRVFVCSMADLFGEWVPQDWIDKVFDAALKAPEWEYLFLTKFPQRYRRINLPPKAWFGASVDIQKRVKVTEKSMPGLDVAVRWISVEPMLEPITFSDLSWCDLVVIGAQSETIQPDGFVPGFAPKLEWVIDLIAQAREFHVPVYLKPNLLGDLTGSKPGMQLPQEQPRRRKK